MIKINFVVSKEVNLHVVFNSEMNGKTLNKTTHSIVVLNLSTLPDGDKCWSEYFLVVYVYQIDQIMIIQSNLIVQLQQTSFE